MPSQCRRDRGDPHVENLLQEPFASLAPGAATVTTDQHCTHNSVVQLLVPVAAAQSIGASGLVVNTKRAKSALLSGNWRTSALTSDRTLPTRALLADASGGSASGLCSSTITGSPRSAVAITNESVSLHRELPAIDRRIPRTTVEKAKNSKVTPARRSRACDAFGLFGPP